MSMTKTLNYLRERVNYIIGMKTTLEDQKLKSWLIDEVRSIYEMGRASVIIETYLKDQGKKFTNKEINSRTKREIIAELTKNMRELYKNFGPTRWQPCIDIEFDRDDPNVFFVIPKDKATENWMRRIQDLERDI